MLNAICITTNQLKHIQTNLCIHLSYLEDQRNLKIYNKNIFKKEEDDMTYSAPVDLPVLVLYITSFTPWRGPSHVPL